MKKAIAILLLLILMLFLSGCDSHLNAGTVISKKYIPTHKLYQPMVMIINKHTTILPRWINIPDKWFITVQAEGKSDTWQVSEDYYGQVEIGDYIKEVESQ